MKVALYQPWIYLRGGIERWIFEIVSRSEHDWNIYTHHYSPADTFPELRQLNVIELEPRVSMRRSFGPLARASKAIISTKLPDDGAEVVLISSEGLGDLIAAREHRPTVCYCHTPLKILHDEVTHAELRRRSPKQAMALSLLGPSFAAVDRAMWRHYAHVMANSHETARRVRSAGLAAEIEVIRPGVDLHRWGAPPALGELANHEKTPTLLVAGRIMWQKHIELAIDALRVLLDQTPQSRVSLVIAGAVDAKSKTYLAALRHRAEGLPVRFVVNPSDDELLGCYQAATLVLFTPLNEDWGIVPLEAMAAGVPVIAIDAGGPRESVRHGETGWLLGDDPSAWAAVIQNYLGMDDHARDRFRIAARQRAAQFPWEAAAERIDEVVDRAAFKLAT